VRTAGLHGQRGVNGALDGAGCGSFDELERPADQIAGHFRLRHMTDDAQQLLNFGDAVWVHTSRHELRDIFGPDSAVQKQIDNQSIFLVKWALHTESPIHGRRTESRLPDLRHDPPDPQHWVSQM
jgi:hypothetical protein